MPVLNEERHLAEAVAQIQRQDYPGQWELILALGPSTDRTDAIAADLSAGDARIRVVPNPSGATPAGLNAAIGAAAHDVVVRVDGHALFPTDYLRVAVDVLEATGADNVGGVMAAEGTTPFEEAVAAAMTSRLGVGSARFHTGGAEGPAETVYLGAFRRAALERVGGYDEDFVRAQDWEMNHRIRQSGGTVWFTPRMRVTYRPRADVSALARQYRDYGRWRRVVARQHRGTISPRYLAPPVALIGVVAGTAAGLLGLRAGWLLPGGYALLVLGGSAAIGIRLPWRSAARLPVVLPVMHMAWGWGFLTSPAKLARR
jgi:glycosyltransferase involved in cell wall biosynthesis